MLKNVVLHSVATAFARSVLPVPVQTKQYIHVLVKIRVETSSVIQYLVLYNGTPLGRTPVN